MSGLVDTHCHLSAEAFRDDLEGVLTRAATAGVERAVLIGMFADDWLEVLEIVERFRGQAKVPRLHAALGVHPARSGTATEEDYRRLDELLDSDDVVAVGETGLDLYWDDVPLDVQREALERHVEIALDRDLPLVLHLRDAYAEAAEQLERHAGRGLRAVVHCFGGRSDEIHPFVDWGWPVSFSGILTYQKADNVREAAAATPLDQCLIETDAPYLAPRQAQARVNEPAFVAHTARTLARVKEIEVEELARVTTRNAERFFRLPS